MNRNESEIVAPPCSPAIRPDADGGLSTEEIKGRVRTGSPETPLAAAEKEGNSEYKVGYKRPPKHTRFKPGVSGNPKGREPKRWSAKGEIRRQYLEKLTVQEGTKKRRLPKLTLLIRSLIHKGIKGDTRAALAAYKLAADLRVLEIKRDIKYDFEALTPEERKIQEQWLQIMSKHHTWNDITDALLALE